MMTRWLCAALPFVVLLAGAVDAASRRVLTVCADPDNLPFSNEARQGFENRIAALVARELGATLAYTWQTQRRGFLRRGLQGGACDVVIGVTPGLPGVATTRPYYASTYVFVTREHAAPVQGFDDPALRTLRIGVHAIGVEGSNPPPVSALARRGLAANVVGFPMWGEVGGSNPQGRVVDAVAAGTVDVAVVWGPLGGYFAKPYRNDLVVTEVTGDPQLPAQPFVFEVAMGVRRSDGALKDELDRVLARRQPDIDAILHEYAVPRVASAGTAPH